MLERPHLAGARRRQLRLVEDEKGAVPLS